jgi:hypothetical protein
LSQHPGETVDPLAGRRYWVPRSALSDPLNALFVHTICAEPQPDPNAAQQQFRCWPNAQSVSDPAQIDLEEVMGPLSVETVEKTLTWDDLPSESGGVLGCSQVTQRRSSERPDCK